MNKLSETYAKILISESKIILGSLKPINKNIPTIDEVKNELINLFKVKSWNEFIDIQKAGQCDFIAKAVCRLFPKFKMVSVYVDFSDEAKKKLGNGGYTYATHFLNKLGKKYYDFAKGTNCYDGTYVLEGLGNKYDVEVNNKESKQFHDEIKVNPKEIGTIIREGK